MKQRFRTESKATNLKSKLCSQVCALILLCHFINGCSMFQKSSPQTKTEPMRPVAPASRTVDHVDTYHGIDVADPYRWLENETSHETKTFVTAQNEYTQKILDNNPLVQTYRDLLTRDFEVTTQSSPQLRDYVLYFLQRNPGADQPKLYRRVGNKSEELVDPNAWSSDGTVSLGEYSVSPDNKLIAISQSEGGSDWRTWKVFDLETMSFRSDEIYWSKFSEATWLPDSSAFTYSRYPAPKTGAELAEQNTRQSLMLHRIGTPQSEDITLFESPENPTWGFSPTVSEDEQWLVIHIWDGTDRRNRVYLKPLPLEANTPIIKLLDAFDAGYQYISNDGDTFIFQTDHQAPKGRIVAIDLDRHETPFWTELLAQQEATLTGVHQVKDYWLITMMENASDTMQILDKATWRITETFPLPTLGSVAEVQSNAKSNSFVYGFQSFTYPSSLFKVDLPSSLPYEKPKTGAGENLNTGTLPFQANDFVVKQEWYSSKDGTHVPMFIIHHKDVNLSQPQKTMLYGYGGFNIALSPYFKAARLAWLERGNIFAMPNLRGGDEFGEAWHEAGMLHKKQNVFDDFAWAAKHLIAKGYTTSSRLAISGRSNGGLLVGATITQNPDLASAAIAGVGVMDMLRFQNFTIGHAWVSEYGSSDNPKDFKTLYAYSPYHNIRPQAYPATMVTTADHDDRVVPRHSYKFAARLQANQQGSAPIVLRVDVKAGHGAGKPVAMQIDEFADIWAFVESNLQ